MKPLPRLSTTSRSQRTLANVQARRASVLLLTLIVVAMLTLGASAYFQRMASEHRAARAHGRRLQTRALAESGVEYVKAVAMQDPLVIQQSGGLYANPSMFQGKLVTDDPLAAFRGRFTIVAPDMTTDGLYAGVRYGLENESSRLNLNTVLLAESSSEDGAKRLLMTLPGMTEPIAEAILDWLDEDDQPRLLGAEREYYSTLSPAYAPRNGPLGSIDELLLVRDVTPALLYGADLNRNYAIDGLEEPLTVIDNADNSSGLLNRGWSAYLTLDSAEANLRPDGRPKIDVNQADLQELHKEVSQVLGNEMANFIVAFRQGGPHEGNEAGQAASGIQLDFSQQGRYKLKSVLDLVGARTRIAKQGQASSNDDDSGDRGERAGRGSSDNSRIVVNAAFADDPSAMRSYLTRLMDNLTVNPSPSIPGRLNINQAPRCLLAGIPGLTGTQIDQIMSRRDVTLGLQQPDQTHETWLLTGGIVDLETMKKLMPLVTAGGRVYRAQVVGFFDADGPVDRLEVVVDATRSPPVVRRRRELDELGAGYPLETLGAALENQL